MLRYINMLWRFRQQLGRYRSRAVFWARQLLGTEPRLWPDSRIPTIRLGLGYGEWFLSPAGLGSNSIIYSVGVGTDITFDLDLIERFGCSIYAFDPTPKSLAWIEKQELPNSFHFYPYGLANFNGKASFALPLNHGVSYVMGMTRESQDSCDGEVYALETIMEQLGHSHIDVLKLDIEGAEYSIIQDIVRNAPKIQQLLIEFHHRFPEYNSAQTTQAIATLRTRGFSLFYIAPSGLEYSFINTNYKSL